MNRRGFHIAASSSIVLAATGRSWAEEEQDDYAVKVGDLYNFCNYVRWPSQVSPNSLTIGVLGPALNVPETLGTIRQLNGQEIANRQIVLRAFTSIEKYQPCDMVFATGAEAADPDILAKLVKLTEKGAGLDREQSARRTATRRDHQLCTRRQDDQTGDQAVRSQSGGPRHQRQTAAAHGQHGNRIGRSPSRGLG